METKISQEDIQQIVESRHDTPHKVLGPHCLENRQDIVVRAFLPHADDVLVWRNCTTDTKRKMHKIHPEGLYEVTFSNVPSIFHYQLVITDDQGNTVTIHDPYSITTFTFDEYDHQLFSQGNHYRLYEKLGAHPMVKEGIQGMNFAVWAPNPQRVSVVGTFNRWDGRCHQMTRLGQSGVWELFIPGLSPGELYKYEIKTGDNNIFIKTDPFAFYTEVYPNTAAIAYGPYNNYQWNDGEWMAKKKIVRDREHPVSVYELGRDIWPKADSEMDMAPTYQAIANRVIPYAKNKAFTHIAIAVVGHDPHQTISYYAPSSRYGGPEDFMEFVDICHQNDIGVILSWIPSFFPQDASEFACFDGTQLYEYQDLESQDTAMFNHQKGEVRSFLMSNALFWIEEYHIDGLVADSLSAVLYENYLEKGNKLFSTIKLFIKDHPSRHTISKEEIQRTVQARHNDPHSILGPHYLEAEDAVVIRALLPDADQVHVVREAIPELIHQMNMIHEAGLFQTSILKGEHHIRYRFHITDKTGNKVVAHDAYAFTSLTFSPNDHHLFSRGKHYRIFDKLGAHPRLNAAVRGVNFAIWAPNAERVSVVGNFNHWDGRRHQMKLHGESGVWEIFVPGLYEGDIYKYEIRTKNGDVFLKTDPYAFYTEVPPHTASIVYELGRKHRWNDDDWMQKKAKNDIWRLPVSIYEVHLGSWMKAYDNNFLSYTDLAKKLVPYVRRLGFTHIELLPIAEHPYAPSWGYQISNFYAPTSRYGKPEDLMAFVDVCHQNGIGVILDWVPAHFPKDAHALAWFDGTALYEHADPRQGEHRDWGTLIFNYGRHEVENFLIANALFWLDTYHFDGLRVDAVASMLYLDYSRKSGEWIPNIYGGNENLEAIAFLKHMNNVVHERIPGAMMIAEESTAWPAVSRPVDAGGLGFGFKWNMGWMHDVLLYMGKDPVHRRYHHRNLTFGFHYAFDENFILPLSHDEVVHLKASLINKMPGDEWQKFANLRLLYTFMYTHPGKKLIFMGGEFGQWSEWNHAQSLEWELLDRKPHQGLLRFMMDLNRLYCKEKALYEVDFKSVGFEGIELDSARENVIAFGRKALDPRNCLFFAMNFSPIPREAFRIGVPYPTYYIELLNSDAEEYWGRGMVLPKSGVKAEEIPWHGYEFSLSVSLPALGATILKPLPLEMEQTFEQEPVRDVVVYDR